MDHIIAHSTFLEGFFLPIHFHGRLPANSWVGHEYRFSSMDTRWIVSDKEYAHGSDANLLNGPWSCWHVAMIRHIASLFLCASCW
jgi:hypothetical protein